jgi:hypothetical protein
MGEFSRRDMLAAAAAGGMVAAATSTETVVDFPVSQAIAGVLMSLVPGGYANCTGTPTRRSGPM